MQHNFYIVIIKIHSSFVLNISHLFCFYITTTIYSYILRRGIWSLEITSLTMYMEWGRFVKIRCSFFKEPFLELDIVTKESYRQQLMRFPTRLFLFELKCIQPRFPKKTHVTDYNISKIYSQFHFCYSSQNISKLLCKIIFICS